MRKINLLALLTASLLTLNGYAQYPCTTHSMSEEVIKNDPAAQLRRQALENAIRMGTGAQNKIAAPDTALKIIPIVFHIIHTGGGENITKEQVEDAVRIINRDYKKRNADTSQVAPAFAGIIGKPNLEFRLAKIDPAGNCTDGITRTFSILHAGGADANIKGLISWNTTMYLNVYCVSNIESGAGAYAYLPGTWPTGSNREGIVCRVSQLGSIGQSGGSNLAERTLTHEIGHFMNLNHTWGHTNTPGLPENCNDDDDVFDTPNTVGVANQDCNKDMISCGNLNNVENYMDYSSCERMFTDGQVERMRLTLASSVSARDNLWSSANLIATGTNDGFIAPVCSPKADFFANRITCAGDSIRFTDNSWKGIVDSREWTFEGGTPSTSTLSNPAVIYAAPGVYKVKLKVTNAGGSDSTERTSYITVLDRTNPRLYTDTEDMEDANTIGSTVFPVSDDLVKWDRTTAAGYTGSASVYLKVFGNPVGKIDAFYLRPIDLTGVTGATLKFKLAHARRNGSTSESMTVSISRNCGAGYFTKYTKEGTALATTSNTLANFVPTTTGQWREESVSLANIQNFNGGLVKFEAISGGGNNIYIDDIQITGTTGVDNILMNNLDMNIVPNPFNSNTQVRFFLTANAKVSLKVYDILGKEIATIANEDLSFGDHSYDINAINTGITESGIYFVKLNVNGYDKVQKIVFTK